jgi:hypothetical protein
MIWLPVIFTHIYQDMAMSCGAGPFSLRFTSENQPPDLGILCCFKVDWWRFRDSNPGPADYDSVALTS